MRVHRKQVKKRMIFILLLALLVSMARPSGSYADEPEGTDTVSQKEDLVPEDAAAQQTSDEQSGETRTDTLQPTANNYVKNETGLKENALDLESNEENSAQQKERAGQFESDAPVIERVEFGQNHTTVASNAEITLSVYAYDASEIKDVQVDITVENSEKSQRMNWSKGAGQNEYVCTYKLDGKTWGRLSINSINVIDEYNNLAAMDIYVDEPDGYWVDIEESERDTIQAKSFKFPQSGKTIEFSTFEMSMEVELQKPIEEQYVWLYFVSGEKHFEVGLSAADSGTSHSIFNNSSGGTYGYSSFSSTGEYSYTLQDVYVKRGDFVKNVPVIIENKENYGFTLKVDETYYSKDSITITSVSLDKQGENVKQGDEIDITVDAKDAEGKELPIWGKVYFVPAASNIDASEKEVELELNKTDNRYHGTLKVENMYPCEWYIHRISIGNDYYADDGRYTYEAGFPCYVNVYDGEAFVNPEFDLEIIFMALDENGEYQSVSRLTKKNVQRRQTLKEIGATFPEMSSNYAGLTQLGWMYRDGKEITEDTSVMEGGYFDVYAKYDKGVFDATYKYPNNAGGWSRISHPIVYEYGTTYGELIKKVQEFIPEDITKKYSFSGWSDYNYYGDYKESDVVSGYSGYNLFFADFSGIIVLDVYRDHFDQKGSTERESEIFTVEKGTTYDKAVEMLNASEAPVSYKGLRFKEWNSYAYLGEIGNGFVHNGEDFVMDAVYENYLVRYIINNSSDSGGSDEESIFCQVAEKGETVTALTSFEGFGEITWDEGAAPDKTFVVNNHMTFYGHAKASSTTNPGKPSKPSKPSGGSSSGSGNKPGETTESKLPDSTVNSIVNAVKNAEQGENIKVNMGSKSVISKEILEAARGKDVSVTLEMEGYSWTINGKDIMAANLQDIDLRVIKNTDHIPSSTVKALAGNNPCMQLTLVHEGNFGFKATLNIGVGSEYSGKYGNLYYHDSAGKMVFVNAGQIDANGYVSLEFSHASNYLLVMSDQAMSQAEVPANLTPTGTDQGGTQSAANTGIRKSAKTGDYTMMYLWLFLCVAAMGIVVYTFRRKRV